MKYSLLRFHNARHSIANFQVIGLKISRIDADEIRPDPIEYQPTLVAVKFSILL